MYYASLYMCVCIRYVLCTYMYMYVRTYYVCIYVFMYEY